MGIIGGGFAGLSAALLLGRYLRSVVIFDVIKNREYNIHGYLGFENLPISEAIKKSWTDVLQYGSVRRITGKVEKVEKDTESNLFVITPSINTTNKEIDLKKKTTNETFRAKYIIIATGVEHPIPSIRNFEKYLGNGIWHCPHCDGFAATNKKLIIIASKGKNNEAIDYAKVFLGWTKDITVFFQEPRLSNTQTRNKACGKLTNEQSREAISLGINIVEDDEIVEIISESETNSINSVLTKNNVHYKADIIFYHLGIIIQNEIARQLGCEFDEDYVKVNEKQLTSVSNVYAAGDIDTDRHYSILASASGAIAAVTIYEQLLKEAISITKLNHLEK